MSDWDSVTVIRKKTGNSAAQKSSSAINSAMRSGKEVVSEKKTLSNAQHGGIDARKASKIDNETEDFHIAKVGLSVSKAIQQARQAKGLTQKDLATKINEKPSVVNDYEAGKALNPNQQILMKLERALGVKLRGKDIGAPLSIGPKKMTSKDCCIKCKGIGNIYIRRTLYCQLCFLEMLKLKFDSAMGQSTREKLEAKVLVCLNENDSSVLLLDFSKKYFMESSTLTFKKRNFQMMGVVECRIKESNRLDLVNELDLEEEYSEISDFGKYQTSKQDLEQILRFKMFADFAIKNQCNALLFPDTCTDLAIRSISDTALGKGLGLASNIAPALNIMHKGHSLLLVRPLYDITDADVAHYNSIFGLDSQSININITDKEKEKENNTSSIQNITKSFLMQLEKEHPSTINIITKTCLRLPQKFGDGLCTLCQGPRLMSDSEWRKSHTLWNTSLNETLETIKSKKSLDSDSTFSSLCYSCQNIFIDVENDDDKLSFVRRISYSEIKNEINEYLL